MRDPPAGAVAGPRDGALSCYRQRGPRERTGARMPNVRKPTGVKGSRHERRFGCTLGSGAQPCARLLEAAQRTTFTHYARAAVSSKICILRSRRSIRGLRHRITIVERIQTYLRALARPDA